MSWEYFEYFYGNRDIRMFIWGGVVSVCLDTILVSFCGEGEGRGFSYRFVSIFLGIR